MEIALSPKRVIRSLLSIALLLTLVNCASLYY